MKALVGAFNQEKALVGAFSVIVQPVVEPMDCFTALILIGDPPVVSASLSTVLRCMCRIHSSSFSWQTAASYVCVMLTNKYAATTAACKL